MLRRTEALSAINASDLLEHRPNLDTTSETGDLRERLLLANLRLVGEIANGYARGRFLELGDLFQEGVIGLQTAVDKFDPFRGFAFSTYATPWIRQAVSRALADGDRTVRLPVHAVDEFHRMRLSRARDAEEIEAADAMLPVDIGSSEAFSPLDDSRDPSNDKDEAADRLYRRYLAADTPPLPIDAVDERQIDPMSLAECEDPFDSTERVLLKADVAGATSRLPEIRRRVITLRFGLDDSEHRTLEEVGRSFNLTRERIRQIEAAALRTLRKPRFSIRLRGYDPRDLGWGSVVATSKREYQRRHARKGPSRLATSRSSATMSTDEAQRKRGSSKPPTVAEGFLTGGPMPVFKSKERLQCMTRDKSP
jgi:RNA polymerase primary sigma factor